MTDGIVRLRSAQNTFQPVTGLDRTGSNEMEAVSIAGIAVEAGGATVFGNGNSCYLDMGAMTGSWKCGGAWSPIIGCAVQVG